MAVKHLHQFLVALSKFSSVRSHFRKDPGAVMTEAGLSKKEQALVSSGDTKAIRSYLGDDAPGAKIQISYTD